MDTAGEQKALKQTSSLRAPGGTAFCQGLVDGVNITMKRSIKDGIASVMILTDGQANQGPTSTSEINATLAQQLKLQGQSKSTDKIAVEESKQQQEGDTVGGSDELPCTINNAPLI